MPTHDEPASCARSHTHTDTLLHRVTCWREAGGGKEKDASLTASQRLTFTMFPLRPDQNVMGLTIRDVMRSITTHPCHLRVLWISFAGPGGKCTNGGKDCRLTETAWRLLAFITRRCEAEWFSPSAIPFSFDLDTLALRVTRGSSFMNPGISTPNAVPSALSVYNPRCLSLCQFWHCSDVFALTS